MIQARWTTILRTGTISHLQKILGLECFVHAEVSNQALDGWHFSCTPRCIRFRRFHSFFNQFLFAWA